MTTASICEWPQFLRLALKHGYAGIGHVYGSGTSGNSVLLPDCGRQIWFKVKPTEGESSNIYGNHFIASRKAVHFTPLSVYQDIYTCFQSLPEKVRPRGFTHAQWEKLIPGQKEAGMFEIYGASLFGVTTINRQNITRIDLERACHDWTC